MHIVEPGWTVRAFRLDGTSVVGTVESGPYRAQDGKIVDKTVRLHDGSEHRSHLCEPAGETLRTWPDSHPTKVHFDPIAYGAIDKILGGHWSSHLTEYVDIDWERRTMKTNQLSTFVGSTRVYDKDGCLVKDDGDVRMPAEEVLEKLAPIAWAFQDDEVERLKGPITDAFQNLQAQGIAVAHIHLPRWAKGIWPGERVFGVPFCKAPFPMVLSQKHYGRFAAIIGIFGAP
jgi:hypothetical protein